MRGVKASIAQPVYASRALGWVREAGSLKSLSTVALLPNLGVISSWHSLLQRSLVSPFAITGGLRFPNISNYSCTIMLDFPPVFIQIPLELPVLPRGL